MRMVAILGFGALSGLVAVVMEGRAIDRAVHQHEAVLVTLQDFRVADSEMNRDVLRARTGRLHHYDALVEADRRAQAALSRLLVQVAGDAVLEREAERVHGQYSRKTRHLERFKTLNALLTNSSMYFLRESDLQIRRQRDPDTLRVLGFLTHTLQRLVREPGSETTRAAREALARTAAIPSADSLVRHGALLLTLLPDIEAEMSAMPAIADMPSFVAIGARVAERQRELQRRSHLMRMKMLAIGTAMAALSLLVGWRLHLRVRASRRRATYDEMMLSASQALASASREQVDCAINAALGALRDWAGVRAAALATRSHTGPLRLWPDVDADMHSAAEASLAERPTADKRVSRTCLLLSDTGTVLMPDARTARYPPSARWLCVRREDGRGRTWLLCLDRADMKHALYCAVDLPLLESALDILTGVLEKHRLEGESKRLEEQLLEARRLEAIGTMASGISHNFNNIVGAIRGNAESALEQLPAIASAREPLTRILRSTERAHDLVEGILDYGRAQRRVMERVDLDELINETAALLTASLPTGVTLQVARPHAPVTIWGNPAQLQQIIMNLCTNGARAMNMQGTLRVSLAEDAATGHDGTCSITLRVDDSGIGISPDDRERIFEPFYTTERDGTGLGLATVKQIVSNHRGCIHVESTPGRGTSFLVTLPSRSRPGAGAVAPRKADDAVDHMSVMLVSADMAVVERLEDILAALGHEPVGYATAHSAYAALRAQPLRFDCVVLDQEGMAADDVRKLREAAAVPVLIATRRWRSLGRSDDRDVSGFVRIPTEPAALADALQRARATAPT